MINTSQLEPFINSKRRVVLPRLLTLVSVSRLLFDLLVWRIDGWQGFFSPDTMSYLTPAQSLLHGSFAIKDVPEILRTPGYPLLLSLAIASGHVVICAILSNVLLAVLSAWLIWRITSAISANTNAAVWAVLFYCFEPVGFIYSAKLLSDTLFCTQLLLFVWLFLRFLQKPSWKKVLLAGASLACATYTRPTSLFLGFWLAPLLLLFPRTAPVRRRVLQAAAFPVVFAVALLPWFVRNTVVAGYTGFSSVSDVSLYFLTAAAIEAKVQHKTFSQMQQEFGDRDDRLYIQVHPEQRSWTRGQKLTFQRNAAKTIISRHPLTNLRIHFTGCLIVAFEPGATELLKMLRLYPESVGMLSRVVDIGIVKAIAWLTWHYPAVSIPLSLMAVQLIAYYVLGLIGLRLVSFEVRVVFLSLVLYFILVSGGPGAGARYRMPIMPIVCVCAGVAIANWKHKPAAYHPLSHELPWSNK